jgi:hypothetical protein
MSAALRAPAPDPGAERAGAAAGPAAALDPALEWTFNPWRQDLRKAATGALAAAAVTAVVARLGLPPLALGALAVAFLVALHPAFLPTRCLVDGDGVARRLAFVWERRAWPVIRRARIGRRGLFVSPRLTAGRLDAFGGLWLPLPPGAPPALVAELRRRLAAHGL